MWAIDEIRWVQVNFTFENFDHQDEGHSEMPAIGRDKVELAVFTPIAHGGGISLAALHSAEPSVCVSPSWKTFRMEITGSFVSFDIIC